MIDHSTMKLGGKPPRHDRRTLRLADYVTTQLVPHPRVDWLAKVTNLGMMGNDVVGDCVFASPGHLIQSWTANNGNQVILPDSAILKGYSDVTGYVPGDPSTDNGTITLDMLNYWRKTGIGGHKLFAYVGLEPRNKTHVELAIDLLGGSTIGLALPVSAQRQRVWSVTGGDDALFGSWGNHEVPLLNYGPTGVTCVTWGEPKTITWSFLFKYCTEAFGLLSDDWATGTKNSPSGFSFSDLQADLAQITA